MRKIILIYIILLVFVSFISGLCNNGQIDINKASLEELDNFYGVGPVKAQAIIDSRPFESVNDLTKVSGIGEITLDKILDQGLACVDSEQYSETEETNNQTPEKEDIINKSIKNSSDKLNKKIPLTPKVISLTPKDIKSEEDKKVLGKKDYAKYGFIGFCILIGVLLILKNKRKNGIV